jgi:hypothetical protein
MPAAFYGKSQKSQIRRRDPVTVKKRGISDQAVSTDRF